MRHLHKLFPVIALALLFAACAPATNLPTSTSPSGSPYPAPRATYQPYPGPTFTRDPSIIPFSINKPLHEGDTQITGTGPAGVPINLQDVTFMGELLAETVIGADNTFTFMVAPLEQKHRLGLALSDLTGTAWKPEDFYSLYYEGSEPLSIPQMNLFYDTAFVQPRP